jgi:hypothetical protein
MSSYLRHQGEEGDVYRAHPPSAYVPGYAKSMSFRHPPFGGFVCVSLQIYDKPEYVSFHIQNIDIQCDTYEGFMFHSRYPSSQMTDNQYHYNEG